MLLFTIFTNFKKPKLNNPQQERMKPHKNYFNQLHNIIQKWHMFRILFKKN